MTAGAKASIFDPHPRSAIPPLTLTGVDLCRAPASQSPPSSPPSSLAAGLGAAQAQGYPTKSIRLIVPLAAGSTADIISRIVGAELAKSLGQAVVIENKTGAGGTIAMAEVARSAPDGYTISFGSQGTLVFNQALYANRATTRSRTSRPSPSWAASPT